VLVTFSVVVVASAAFVRERLATLDANVIVHVVLVERFPAQPDVVVAVYPGAVVVPETTYRSFWSRTNGKDDVVSPVTVEEENALDVRSSTEMVDVAPPGKPATLTERVLVEMTLQELPHAGFTTMIVDEAVLVAVLVRDGDSVTVTQFVS
jgi:hypothetical protein